LYTKRTNGTIIAKKLKKIIPIVIFMMSLLSLGCESEGDVDIEATPEKTTPDPETTIDPIKDPCADIICGENMPYLLYAMTK
jgi:hypothetical protein